MDEMLAGAGILCILAAIMTRQLKAAGRNIPVLISSPRRQALLAALGAVLLGASFLADRDFPARDHHTAARHRCAAVGVGLQRWKCTADVWPGCLFGGTGGLG